MDFLEEEFNEILNIFQVESEEIIARLNNSLLELEKNPKNKDAIINLFRDAHSLKGASRMIGFNNVQTIAHKIEDILGLAKENEIQLNSKTVDVVYKAVDFLSELIQKSVAQKHEIYSEEIPKQISNLENITTYVDGDTQVESESEFNLELFLSNINKINELISECLFLLMGIEQGQDGVFVQSLTASVNELYNIFKDIGLFEIKKNLEDMKVKLDFVSRATNSLTVDEGEKIQQNFNTIISDITSLCEIYSIEAVDYFSLAFDMASKGLPALKAKEEIIETEIKKEILEEISAEASVESLGFSVIAEPEIEIQEELREELREEVQEKVEKRPAVAPSNLIFIKDKFSTLVQNNNIATEIIYDLTEFEKNCSDKNVNEIIHPIIQTLDFIMNNQIEIDEDSVSAFIQGIEYCDNALTGSVQDADKDLILQRFEIIQKVLELKAEANEDLVPSTKKEYTIKNKKITDFSQMFDSSEIKTLRVDSAKLDLLANQIGELIITKIKTKKHLHEIDTINKNLQEWQRNSIKSLNYLKYYDKKYFSHTQNIDNPVAFFVKQLLNIFSENNRNFQDTIDDISNLYRTIQEDDTKMNLIVDDLDSMVKNVRVLPLATVFHLFGRMVRDIAQEKNKKIDFEIIGSDTSADKKIIEEIKAPLIHIIRNAIDHGIETSEERIALGKNPVGKILLKAYPAGNNVVIEIHDDGKGINIEKIKEKALKKGYLTKEEINSMTNEQITNIIFTPGFSTGEEITNISGRGIGLDVVHTKISQLNGKVKVISEFNKGCCVQIELPTSMSTLKAFVVKASDKTFAVPMTSINTVVWKKADEIFATKNNKSIIFNEKTTPLYYLADVLHLPKHPCNGRETILIIENENKTIALVVDKLVGDQDILHKKLSAPLYRLKNISGVTTLASGEVCLILNVADLLKSVTNINASKIQTAAAPLLLPKKREDYKILLVDDSITTRTLEKNILVKAGYDIELAINPIEAFEKMKFFNFDLIISDIEMPEMTGLEFLSKLKTDEMYSEIPVIMVSSIMNDERRKEILKIGAHDCIVKGEFNQDEFLVKINSILEG